MTTPRKIVRPFEDALTSCLGEPEALTEQAVSTLNLAGECDGLLRRLESGARDLAERCARYADDVARGHWQSTAPSEYSSVQDMTREKVEFNAKREALHTLIRAVYGKEFLERVRDAVTASYERAAQAKKTEDFAATA